LNVAHLENLQQVLGMPKAAVATGPQGSSTLRDFGALKKGGFNNFQMQGIFTKVCSSPNALHINKIMKQKIITPQMESIKFAPTWISSWKCLGNVHPRKPSI